MTESRVPATPAEPQTETGRRLDHFLMGVRRMSDGHRLRLVEVSQELWDDLNPRGLLARAEAEARQKGHDEQMALCEMHRAPLESEIERLRHMRPRTMSDHICIVCFRRDHPEVCERGCRHWPAVCCPGCACHSFENAHPEPETT